MLLTLAQTANIASPKTQIETVLEYQRTGNKALLATLVESNVRLVMKIAKSYVRQGCSMEDLVSEGTIGIIDAANIPIRAVAILTGKDGVIAHLSCD